MVRMRWQGHSFTQMTIHHLVVDLATVGEYPCAALADESKLAIVSEERVRFSMIAAAICPAMPQSGSPTHLFQGILFLPKAAVSSHFG